MEEKWTRVVIHDPHGNTVADRPISPEGATEQVSEHNADQEAHPYIKEAIAGIRTQVERRLVGAKVTFADGHTEDVELGFNDKGEVILLLPKETFGKIDGVKVNGSELEVDANGKVDINFSASVDDGVATEETPPSVTPTMEGGSVRLDLHNLRGNGITDVEQTTTSSQDEGVNVIKIKTDTNPEGTPFEVRNGSRGNGLASVSEEMSNVDGGLNTYTLTDTDGNTHVIHTRNGRPGADRQPVENGDVIIAQTTGTDKTKVMSQKSVTEAIISASKYNVAEIDLSELTENAYYIWVSENKWTTAYNQTINRRCKLVPVTQGKYLLIKKIGDASNVAVLKSNNYANGVVPDYASGCTINVFYADDTKMEVDVPSDGTLLYFMSKYDNAEEISISIFKVGDSAFAQGVGEDEFKGISQKGATKIIENATTKSINLDSENGGDYFKVNLGSNGKWANTYYSRFYAVKPNRKYRIVAKEDKPVLIVILKTCKPVLNSDADFAGDYTSRILIAKGEVMDIIMPSDAHYICVQMTNSTGNIAPQSIEEFKSVKDVSDVINPVSEAITGNALFYNIYKSVPMFIVGTFSDLYIEGSHFWYSYQSRGCYIYAVEPNSAIRITAKEDSSTNFVFLRSYSLETASSGQEVDLSLSSVRTSVLAGQHADIVVPEDAHYLVVYTGVNRGNAPLSTQVFVPKSDFEKKSVSIIIDGAGQTPVNRLIPFNEGRILRIAINNPNWKTGSVTSGYPILRMFNDVVNVVKGQEVNDVYYVKSNDYPVLTFRGDVGEKVTLDICDVTDDYQKMVYDIAFVEDETDEILQSMTFKMVKGQKMTFRVVAEEEAEFAKIYSMANLEESYKIESLTASESGIQEGEFLANRDCYLVLKSEIDENINPYCKVYEVGNDNKGYAVVQPYQFIVKEEEITTLLSPFDEDASDYDNRLLNAACVMQVESNMWYMWYMGYGQDIVTPTWLMAYSTDGLNWVRGIPNGIEPPHPDTNVIFMPAGFITGEFPGQDECVNEFVVVKVSDATHPFRCICNIRNATTNRVDGECVYMMKSADGANWQVVRKMLPTAHDTLFSAFVVGDLIKVYLRMWDYTKSTDEQREVGVFYCDINGQIVMPPSGLFGHGLYMPCAFQIGFGRELMIPTKYFPTSEINTYESYIYDNGVLRYAPSYHLEKLKKPEDNDGWGHVCSMVCVNGRRYVVYSQRPTKHNVGGANGELRAVPIEWVTYDSSNRDSNMQ